MEGCMHFPRSRKATTYIFLLYFLQNTFVYSSSYWENTKPYNVEDGLSNPYSIEAKFAGYSELNFTSLCLGMKTDGKINWVKVNYTAVSLHDVIKGETFKAISGISRTNWKKLINDSSLQRFCNRVGFNNYVSGNTKIRIGILGNDENNCLSPDSWIGFGTEGNPCRVTNTGSCGNAAGCNPDNGIRNIKAFGYILVK